MSRKRKIGLYDLGRLPLIQSEDPGRPSLKKFTAGYDREQAETAARQNAEQDAEQKRLDDERMKPIREKVRKFFSLPLQRMADFRAGEAPVDYVGDYPTRTKGLERDSKQENATYKSFREGLTARGCELSQDGWNRLGSYVSSLAENRSIAPTPAVWEKSLERLVNLGVFATGELTNYQPAPHQPAQQPEPKPQEPTLDEVLNSHSVESRSGNAVIKAAVDKDWSQSIRDGFYEFESECQVLFSKDFTTAEIEAMTRIIQARNLNGAMSKSWHAARTLAARANYIPTTWLTIAEQFEWDVETDKVPTNTFEERQAFNRRSAAIYGR